MGHQLHKLFEMQRHPVTQDHRRRSLTNRKSLPYRPILLNLIIIVVLIIESCNCQQTFSPTVVINRPPEFLPGADMAGLTIPEDTPVGQIVYQLKGRDPEGSKVFFYLSGDSLSVNKDTGHVTLIKALDRELEQTLDVIVTIVDEKYQGKPGQTVSLQREVRVGDVNDQTPTFSGAPYSFTVSEATQPFTTVYEGIEVIDRDVGANALVQLDCDRKQSPEACDKFHVKLTQLSEGRYRGSLSLRGATLDFEQEQQYRLILVARDRGGLNSSVSVDITVQDVQDEPPKFLNGPEYRINVTENLATDTEVIRVQVRDGDATPELRRSLRLEIFGDSKKYFDLRQIGDEEWSLQTTQNPIDREDPDILHRSGHYEFAIRAIELINGRDSGDITVANVSVLIEDINDQLPTFSQPIVELEIPEGIRNGSLISELNLTVQDLDVGPNARFGLMIEDLDLDNPASAVFSVAPPSAQGKARISLQVINGELIDYEDPLRRQFAFNIVALQNGVRSSARIGLRVLDSNDHNPQFDSEQYHVQIPENMPSNMTVFTLTATDADSGEYAELSYSLRGYGAEKFAVNERTGEISVAGCDRSVAGPNPFAGHFADFDDEEEMAPISICLDHEAQSSYSLIYEARDGGDRRTEVQLFLEILDVNDNHPEFEQSLIVQELHESETKIVPPLFLKATDADGPAQGGNQAIRYILKETNLTGLLIDAVTGQVLLTKPVQLVQSKNRTTGLRTKYPYAATVRAIDGGDPPLESEAHIIFHVRSERDGAPSFLLEPYNVSIPESAPSGSKVFQVRAIDPDGPDSALRYALIGGARNNFAINELTGEITISASADLDRDLYGSTYRLLISATDSGLRPLSTNATLDITVEDVNNKNPRFSTDNYVLYLTDAQLKPDSEILKVVATDADSTAELRYSIVSERITVRDNTGFLVENGAQLITKFFRVDPITGSVKVASGAGVLDPERNAVIVMPVMATDLKALNGPESQQTLSEITMYIRSEVGKNPLFAAPWTFAAPNYDIRLPEESPIGSTIITLSAKDALTNKPIAEFEKIRETDPGDYFSVAPQTGIVSLKRRLDFEELVDKQFRLAVKAIGMGGPGSTTRPTSIANIRIDVQDINDNAPIFSERSYSIKIPESALWPEKVLKVRATDRDSGAYGQITYFVSGDGSDLFQIDPEHGEIQIRPNVTLDRELQCSYALQVTAIDNNPIHSTDQSSAPASQRSSSVLVKIELTDINDNAPKFEQSPYRAIVPENVPIGFVISYLRASDPDEGPNGSVWYEIIGLENLPPRKRLFSVNSTSGVLSVARTLSGKGRREPYEIQVKASDRGSPNPQWSEATVYIVIGDISANDGVPQFIRPAENEVVTVSENSKPGTFVYQVEAQDADNPETLNGKVMYRFLDPVPWFEIDPLSGIITTATNRRQNLQTYSIDRERTENFTIILVAYDLGLPAQESHRVLFIRVNDTDDNEARFERSLNSAPVQFEVDENMPIGSEIGKVRAIDEDIGVNAQIVYEIINGNERELFQVRSEPDGYGVIRSTKVLDRETDEKFLITIRARNVRQTDPKALKYLPYDRADMSQIQVQIRLRDVDDNPPKFERDQYVVGVKFNTELNSPLATFKASDPDQSDSKPRITYHLIGADYYEGQTRKSNVTHVFGLEPHQGVLRNELSLRSYVNGYFNLTIEAQNGEFATPYSRSQVNCRVFVLRDKEFLKFVFRKRPNEINRSLKQLETDFASAMIGSPLRLALNFDSTQYNQRRDGSLDFESASACFQLIRSTDRGTELVLDHSEGVKFLRPDQHQPHAKSLRDLYENYSIASVEECVPVRHSYKISRSEIGVLLVGLGIAVFGLILACLASGMKRKLKDRMAGLGIVSGYGGPMLVGAQNFVAPISPYGVPIAKTPSFISVADHQRIYEWQEQTSQPPLDTVSFRSFPAR